jgi:hypothetical protein
MFFSHYVSWGLLRLLLYPVPTVLRELLMFKEPSIVYATTKAAAHALCDRMSLSA